MCSRQPRSGPTAPAAAIPPPSPGPLLANIAAEGAPSLRKGPWPIRNGHDYQPTEHELRALHEEDVSPGQAREIDRLYDQLLASSEQIRNRHPAPKH
jgi:hypothetical protein